MTDPVPPTAEATAELAADMLTEAKDEIDRADQKASLLIGGLGITFSIVLSGMIGGDWSPALLSTPGLIAWAVGIVIASASLVSAALAVWPRLTRTPGSGAITYWGQVRDRASPADVQSALAERGLHPPERSYQQLLVLSALVQRKYRAIRAAMVLAGAGTALVAVSFLLVR